MKLLVKPTGSHMYIDPNTGDVVEHNRPSVVRPSSFIDQKVGAGVLKVISNEVPDEMTDDDFDKHFVASDKDQDLAVSSFLSKEQVNTKPPKLEGKK